MPASHIPAVVVLPAMLDAVQHEAPITKDELYAITFEGIFTREAFDHMLTMMESVGFIQTCGTNIVFWQGGLN